MATVDHARTFAYVAMSGEQARGSPGVAWVDTTEGRARYLLLDEVEPERLRVDLGLMIENDGGNHYFILYREGMSIHMFQYDKAALQNEVLAGRLSPSADA